MENKIIAEYVHNNYEHIVEVYNRYISFIFRDKEIDSYYLSPFMNLQGVPSQEFECFCIRYFQKSSGANILKTYQKNNFLNPIFKFIKFILVYIFCKISLKKNQDDNVILIHAFHSSSDLKRDVYSTVKSPFVDIEGKKVIHDINPSFIKLSEILKLRRKEVICSLVYVSLYSLLSLTIKSIKTYIFCKRVVLKSSILKNFPICFTEIFINYLKYFSYSTVVDSLSSGSIYINFWENRGYQMLADYKMKYPRRNLFVNLSITSKASPEYVLLRKLRQKRRSDLLIMSEYNRKILGVNHNYRLFKNYRINFAPIFSANNDRILGVSSISQKQSEKLYEEIKLYGKGSKIKFHPYVDNSKFDSSFFENQDIYSAISKYGIVVYSGFTTAAVELLSNMIPVFKLSDKLVTPYDPLVEENLIKELKNIGKFKIQKIDNNIKDYYLGIRNIEFNNILKEYI
ncbi:MAG: hypothetical protein N4A49_15340 [Marinifilaceae bacterium]|jgi:hypothetical protein|nr:hypothetical protein [Marinifilaceae bacterium]